MLFNTLELLFRDGLNKKNVTNTVQAVLENACQRFSKNKGLQIFGSGRTDSGVHALAQVFHVDLPRPKKNPYTGSEIKVALNFFLNHNNDGFSRDNIFISSATLVPSWFHSRFHATEREYIYRILHGTRKEKMIFHRDRLWQFSERLNLEQMKLAAKELEGLHDFSSFQKTGCKRNPHVYLHSLNLTEFPFSSFFATHPTEMSEIRIVCKGSSFLWNQVRIMIGMLTDVGKGRLTSKEVKQILLRKSRTKNKSRTAPACGLYLTKVTYPEIPSKDVTLQNYS